MMTKFLMNIAIKRSKTNEQKRLNIAYMASIVGIIINIFLSITKLIIGFMISSIGVIADGFNNATDTVSSIVTIIGFKLSNIPPDKEHPYGHGRIEYISGIVVAFLVMLVGFQFIISSFKEIMNPRPVEFKLIPFIILVVSIFFKVWLGIFNKKLAKTINSNSLKALSLDAFGDVLTTTVVVISLLAGRITSFPIDGIIGVIVSILIIYNGFNIIKETTSPLIGEAPPRELLKGIKKDVLSYEYITGVHDLFIHSYGENKTIAVIDAEFPSKLDIVEVYEEVRRAEREIGIKYDLTLVIHMEPLGKESETRYMIRKEIKSILELYPIYKSMHDFDIIEEDGKNIVEFDMVIFGKKLMKEDRINNIKKHTEDLLKQRFPDKDFNITIDVDYHEIVL